MGATFTIIIAVVIVVGLYYLAIGKLVRGLRCFGRYAMQWKSEDVVKVNVMKSLALISDGLANFILFTVIAAPVIAFIVALAS